MTEISLRSCQEVLVWHFNMQEADQIRTALRNNLWPAHKTSVEQLTQTVGFAKGPFYRFLDSKD